MKVLIVDDRERRRDQLRSLLQAHGFEVDLAANGAEALERARQDPPALIVADILMPVMDGFALCRHWKADERLRGIPFVFRTSTYTDPKYAKLAETLGADRYLIEPLDADALVAALRDVLAANAARRPAAPDATVREDPARLREYDADLVRELQAESSRLANENNALRVRLSEYGCAADALRESERKQRSIFQAAPIGIGVVCDRVFLEVNDRLCEITKYSRADLIGRSSRFWYPTDEEYEYVGREKYRQIAESGTGAVETRLRRKDGEIIDVLLRSTPLDPADLSAGVTFTALDITARKHAERELETIFDMSLDLICIADLRTATFKKVNPAFTHVLGFSEEELSGVSFFDFMHPDDIQRSREIIEHELKQGKNVLRFENRYRTKQGEYRWLSWSSHPVPAEELTYAVARDVTDERLAEERIRESETRYRLLFESADAMIAVYDRDGVCQLMNRRAAAMYGGEPRDLIGKSLHDLHPEIAEASLRNIRRVIDDGETLEAEHQVMYPQGLRAVRSRVWPVPDAHGIHRTALTITEDITERKRAEEALQRSERRLAEAQRIAKIGDYTWEVETGRVRWSDALFELVGYDKSDPVDYAEVTTRIRHPEDRDRVARWLRECLESDSDRLTPNEYRIIRKDGETIHVRIMGVIRRDAGKSPIVFATVQDITERKRAEQALRESGERLRMALQAARMGTWEWDLKHNRVEWSPETLRIFAIEADEFGGTYEAYREFVAPDARREVDARVNDFLRGARESSIIHYEHEIVRGDNEHAWIEVRGTVFLDDAGEPFRMTGVCADITARKRVEAALRLTQFAVDNMPIGIFCVSPDGRIESANAHACRSLGYTADELCRLSVLDIDPTFDREHWLEHRRRIHVSGGATIETVHQRKDGTTFPVEITVTKGSFEGHEFSVSFACDLTERKQAEVEREKLEAQLRQAQKLEAVGQLAGGVAHDFNNILTAIMGNLELSMDSVRTTLGPGHDIVDAMEQIEQAAQRASALTRQLLTFSRRDVTQPEVLNLNNILAGLDKMLRRLITEDISLESVTDRDLKSVRADAGQIEQVIVNLVVNAVHAMPLGGRLTLETRNVTLEADYTRTHVEAHAGQHVMLAVSDTGHGMDADTRERIFEPFFTTKAPDKGTGLGLATVHGIVKQSGGHIMVYSEPDRGTTFKVYLPAIDAAPTEHAPEKQPSTALHGDETILLCEDDRPVRELVAMSLRTAGYTVLTAGTGGEGLKIANEYDGVIDLLITDVIMPDINGRALSEGLQESRPGLPTLFISGYTSNVIAHHGVLDKGVEFLEKPFTRQRLLEKVRAMLTRARTDA